MRHSPYYRCATAIAERRLESKRPAILTIDDDPNVSQALRRRFGQYEVAVLQAHHGTHGIWLATTQRPDTIITDLRMPQGRGQDVVAYLKKNSRTRDIPIIVLTGVFDDGLRRRMLKLGVDEYFIKPISFDELCRAVRRFVDLREKVEGEDHEPRVAPREVPASSGWRNW